MFDSTTPDDRIWDDETGETVGEARARFATFGPLLNAEEALAALAEDSTNVVLSFGYGDDPEYFDSIDEDELRAAIEAGDNVNLDWGPFAIWPIR